MTTATSVDGPALAARSSRHGWAGWAGHEPPCFGSPPGWGRRLRTDSGAYLRPIPWQIEQVFLP